MYLFIEISYHKNIEAYVKLEVYIYRFNTFYITVIDKFKLIKFNF